MADETTTTTETTTAPAESTAADAATETPSTETAATETPTHSGGSGKPTAAEAAQTIKDAPNTAAGAAEVAEAIANAPPETVETLKAMAEKLGFALNGAEVTKRERADFREHQRKQSERLQQQKQEILAEIQAEREKHVGDIEWARQVKLAKDANDYEALARHLGHENWEGLMSNVAARLADPNYQRLLELEQKQKAIEEREARQAQESQKQAQLRAQEERRRSYLGRLSARMAESEDPLVKAFHDDPSFVAQIERIQLENWDDESRSTVSPEQAAAIASRGGGGPAMTTYMRNLYDRLHRVFGSNGSEGNGAVAVAAPPAAAAKPAKTGGKTQIVKGPATEASTRVTDPTDPAFTKQWIDDMRAAADRDRAEGKGLSG